MEVLADGLAFPEGARWKNGALWFSDFYTGFVHRLVPGGPAETVAEVPQQPSGIGWLPDGDLLVVSMLDRKLLRLSAGVLREHADLSAHATFHANDLCVDAAGHAYVGNFGFDPWNEAPRETCLLMVPPEGGRVVRVAEAMAFPNGMALTHRGRRLVVAESVGERLTVFDVGTEGELSGRRLLLDGIGAQPDGIAADTDDHVWVTTMTAGEVLRVAPSGEVVHRIALQTPCWSCAVGDEGDALYVLTSEHFRADLCREHRSGKVIRIPLSEVG